MHPSHFIAAGLLTSLLACCQQQTMLVHACPPCRAQGQECVILARPHWNDTGITLEKGRRYQFHVSGRWTDWFVPSDATGPLCPLFDLALLPTRPGLRYPPSRDLRAKYFSLVGTLGRPQDGRALPAHAFLIRPGMIYQAPETARLHAFANDLPFAYGNNKGCLRLRVQELPARKSEP